MNLSAVVSFFEEEVESVIKVIIVNVLFVDEEGNVSVGHWGFVVLAVIPTDIN